MTEAEWLYGDDLKARIHFLGPKFSFRKARLFAVACGWSVRALAANPTAQAVLHFLERVAEDPDGVGGHELYEAYCRAAGLTRPDLIDRALVGILGTPPAV